MYNSLKLAAVLVAVSATAASAQGNGRNVDGVPPGMRPPAGMCRVWINGVPPGQQPGVTDCATAQTQVRANSRILYGSGVRPLRSYSRHRQLPDGSWVTEHYTRDANGNIVVTSSKPWKHALKAERKAEKRQDKIENRAEKRRDKIEDRAENRRDDDRDEMRGAKHENKGKGKHEKEDRDDDNS